MSSPSLRRLLPHTQLTSFCGSVSTGIIFFSIIGPNFDSFPFFLPREAMPPAEIKKKLKFGLQAIK
jgi:hypothetical protein